jgi:hypothetical protein
MELSMVYIQQSGINRSVFKGDIDEYIYCEYVYQTF